MDYRFAPSDIAPPATIDELFEFLGWFDMIEDPETFAEEADMILPARSALELISDQLTTDQKNTVTKVDKYWSQHAKQFNEYFLYIHAKKNRETALEGWLKDRYGKTPKLPKSHWWWSAI